MINLILCPLCCLANMEYHNNKMVIVKPPYGGLIDIIIQKEIHLWNGCMKNYFHFF